MATKKTPNPFNVFAKLNRLLDTKTGIRNAIQQKGVVVPLQLPFRGYPEKIREIGSQGHYELEDGHVTPTGETFVTTPSSGYDGFSTILVDGEPNLRPTNIAEGITIYGVTGVMKLRSSTNDVGEWQSLIDEARQYYTGPYKYVMVLSSNWADAVGFLMEDFKVTGYDDKTTEFKMANWVYVARNKQTGVWKVENWCNGVSSNGNSFIKNIRYCDAVIWWQGRIIYPWCRAVHTVLFNHGGTTLYTVNVYDGDDALFWGSVPSESGSAFVGWSPFPSDVHEDLICEAEFSNDQAKWNVDALSTIPEKWEEYMTAKYPPSDGEIYDILFQITGSTSDSLYLRIDSSSGRWYSTPCPIHSGSVVAMRYDTVRRKVYFNNGTDMLQDTIPDEIELTSTTDYFIATTMADTDPNPSDNIVIFQGMTMRYGSDVCQMVPQADRNKTFGWFYKVGSADDPNVEEATKENSAFIPV